MSKTVEKKKAPKFEILQNLAINFFCNECNKRFYSRTAFTRHRLTAHVKNNNKKVLRRSKKTDKHMCKYCSKEFLLKYSLTEHLKVCQIVKPKRNSRKTRCCLCNEPDIPIFKILSHYTEAHNIDMKKTRLLFQNYEQFESWKEQMEKLTISKFVKCDMRKSKSTVVYYYKCHRDGFYRSSGSQIRKLKVSGSNKINGHCPAKINVTVVNDTGEIYADYLGVHVGHNMELDKIPIAKSDRQYLASKLRQNVPFDEILDEVAENVEDDDFDRLSLLTKHDLFNIQQSYNLKNGSVGHENACLEVWFNKALENNTDSDIRFYKRQGELQEDYKLEKHDFLLVIMTDEQVATLEKHGNECICVDNIQVFNFQLTTIMVLDDSNQAFPCVFAFSNKTDMDVLRIIFSVIKANLVVEKLSPQMFMSDLPNSFYYAWCEEMGPVNMRLFCSWHVNTVWKKNILAKVKNNEKQEMIPAILKSILEELDEDTYEQMLESCLNDFVADPDLKNFGLYLEKYFVTNRTLWAYCYRNQAGANADIQMELLHRISKNICLDDKFSQRLDKVINCLMKIVQGRRKGIVIPDELKIAHKEAKLLNQQNISICTDETGASWTLRDSKGADLCKVETLNLGCSCDLQCPDCGTCIHAFTCSCLDSSINWNMCKHLHFLRASVNNEFNEEQEEDEDSPEEDIVEELEEDNQEDIEENAEEQEEDNPEDVEENGEEQEEDIEGNAKEQEEDIEGNAKQQEEDNQEDIEENDKDNSDTSNYDSDYSDRDDNSSDCDYSSDVTMKEVECSNEERAFLDQLLEAAKPACDIKERKAKILEKFQSYLNSAASLEHCKVIENALFPIGATFAKMESNKPVHWEGQLALPPLIPFRKVGKR